MDVRVGFKHFTQELQGEKVQLVVGSIMRLSQGRLHVIH
jgi:hypothetical protein